MGSARRGDDDQASEVSVPRSFRPPDAAPVDWHGAIPAGGERGVEVEDRPLTATAHAGMCDFWLCLWCVGALRTILRTDVRPL